MKFPYETEKKNKVIGTYSDGPAEGMAAILECPVGKGKIIFMGTLPDYKYLAGFISENAPSQTGKFVKNATKGLSITLRALRALRADKNSDIAGLVAVDLYGKGGEFRYKNKVYSIEPYGVKIIRD